MIGVFGASEEFAPFQHALIETVTVHGPPKLVLGLDEVFPAPSSAIVSKIPCAMEGKTNDAV